MKHFGETSIMELHVLQHEAWITRRSKVELLLVLDHAKAQGGTAPRAGSRSLDTSVVQ